MKQFYNLKSLLRLSSLFVLLFSVITVVNSCKKDEDEEFKDHVVQFVAKTSTGGELISTVTQIGTAQNTTYSTDLKPLKESWSSGEVWVNSSQAQINFAANAMLPQANSEMTITLYIDGEIARTAKVTGQGDNKVAKVAFSFLEP
ncbi:MULTISPECIES: hypothetical protein [Chryseobacterium]|uniref:DUF4625 domain-containing protein n=1 Tax=Chryseobacterium pennae TaxID=2258962 RepID=A0A3D9C676_9FLAO|nr:MULTISPECIES: hypothetical protein [Chryseobacterium]MCS4304826.1 hypothetical protein [Chryseobacterium sp. BIGb0232]REC61254.1 hypothetical protein DRF65_16175 [Chryseobacterium pennae]ROS09746.1 hypothetical protein EDF65_4497 [Chryseobacterium nakagawai]